MNTTSGYDRPRYILPFDRRGTFLSKFFGVEGPPTPEQTSQTVAEAKAQLASARR